MKQTNKGPLFIIGKPRSGTKLLARILGQHPDIALEVSETQFIPYYLKRPYLISNLHVKENFIRFYNSVIKTYYFTLYHKNLIDVNEWYDLCTDYTFYNVLEVLVKYYSNKLDYPLAIWGDKSNNYIIHVKLIKEHFPNAKFIHIIRDVRDASLSSNKAWGTNIYRYSQRWFNDINQITKDLDSISVHDYIEIKYEELLKHPDKIIKRCVDFLELEFLTNLLYLNAPSEAVGDAKGLTTIKTDNFQKYKKNLSKETILTIEKITWPLLSKYGYQHEYAGKVKNISSLMMGYYQCVDVINRFKFDIGKSGVKNTVYVIKTKFAHFKK